MSKKMQKQSFLHGAAILAAATAIIKLIGALYKIPLSLILSDAGYNYFSNAYDVYSVLLTISTAGLPVAMSRMISQAQTLGNHAQVKRIYKSSLYVFLTIGIAGTLVMAIFAKPLANMIGSPDSWYSILALSPAVVFVCIMSSFRGYFQGQSNMTPTAVSQIIEALSKLTIGLALTMLILNMGYDMPQAAAGSIIGVTIGTVLGAIYLFFQYKRPIDTLQSQGMKAKTTSETIKELLSIAIPITIGAAGLQIINLIDTGIVLNRLQNAAGFSVDLAESIKGIYDKSKILFNLPAAFIVPITISIIPSVTSNLTLKNYSGARKVEQSAIRIMALLALPCCIGLAVLSGPIQEFLFKFNAGQLETATPLLAILGVAVVFNCAVLLTNAIMQAHGRVYIPVRNMLIGGVVKLIVNYILVGNPDINITGAPVGTLCCFFTIFALNLISMHSMMPEGLGVIKIFARPLLASLIMGAAAYMIYDIAATYLPQSIACLGAIAAAVLIYVVCVLLFKIITYEDCLLLPKGEKFAQFLKISPKID